MIRFMTQIALRGSYVRHSTSRRLGRPVIDGGSQVAGSSCVDAANTHESVKLTHGSAERALGMRTSGV